MCEKYIFAEKDGVAVLLKVVPSSSRNELAQILDDALKVRIKKAPEKGKANKEIIVYFSKLFSVPRKNIIIESGETSFFKKIFMKGIDLEKAITIIREALLKN
jgi:uncharacterized protein